jgi:hypothetical protein
VVGSHVLGDRVDPGGELVQLLDAEQAVTDSTERVLDARSRRALDALIPDRRVVVLHHPHRCS